MKLSMTRQEKGYILIQVTA